MSSPSIYFFFFFAFFFADRPLPFHQIRTESPVETRRIFLDPQTHLATAATVLRDGLIPWDFLFLIFGLSLLSKEGDFSRRQSTVQLLTRSITLLKSATPVPDPPGAEEETKKKLFPPPFLSRSFSSHLATTIKQWLPIRKHLRYHRSTHKIPYRGRGYFC